MADGSSRLENNTQCNAGLWRLYALRDVGNIAFLGVIADDYGYDPDFDTSRYYRFQWSTCTSEGVMHRTTWFTATLRGDICAFSTPGRSRGTEGAAQGWRIQVARGAMAPPGHRTVVSISRWGKRLVRLLVSWY